MLYVQLDHLGAKMPGGRPLMTRGQHPVATRHHPGGVGQFEVGPTPSIEATQGSGRLTEPVVKRALGVSPGDVRSHFRGMTQLGMLPMDQHRRAVRQQIGWDARSRGRPQYTEVAIATAGERPGSGPRRGNTTGPPIEWATSTGRTKPNAHGTVDRPRGQLGVRLVSLPTMAGKVDNCQSPLRGSDQGPPVESAVLPLRAPGPDARSGSPSRQVADRPPEVAISRHLRRATTEPRMVCRGHRPNRQSVSTPGHPTATGTESRVPCTGSGSNTARSSLRRAAPPGQGAFDL